MYAIIIAWIIYLMYVFLIPIYPIIQIENASQPKEIHLIGKDKLSSSIKITVKGYISDTAMIDWHKIAPGKVDTIFREADWYYPEYTAKYNPYKCKSGYLTIKYYF
jgi:hypothetical protein